MDVLLRVVAILIEVVILGGIMGAILTGVYLTIFDLGIGKRYRKVAAMAMIVVGALSVFFFIAHLTSFYPTLPGK